MKLAGGVKLRNNVNAVDKELLQTVISNYLYELEIQLEDNSKYPPNDDREILINQIKSQIVRVEKAKSIIDSL